MNVEATETQISNFSHQRSKFPIERSNPTQKKIRNLHLKGKIKTGKTLTSEL